MPLTFSGLTVPDGTVARALDNALEYSAFRAQFYAAVLQHILLEDFSMASTRSSNSIILRLASPFQIDRDPICRVTGYLNASNIVALFEATDLAANPRLPRVNSQVKEMWRVIETLPETFCYKNNGILIAASSCEPLERSRFRIGFEPQETELHPRGILNGGHTTLACITALIRRAAAANDQREPRIILWEELRDEYWPEWRSDVLALLDDINDFQVPVEILFPADGQMEAYDAMIHEIADARNNNCQLTEETKANHAGFYRELKAAIPEDVASIIEWKTNDGGRVKVKDLVALSCIPLSKVSNEVADLTIDLKQCYNSTAKCSTYFNSVYEHATKVEDAVYVLKDDRCGKLVASAVGLTSDVLDVYEWLKIEFPFAYNRAGGNFALIESVKGTQESLSYTTTFRETPCHYSYSDGFIMPILTAITLLIEERDGELAWSQSPLEFLQRHLDRLMKTYKGFIRSQNCDGRLVGRDRSSYELAFETLSMLHEMEALTEQAS